MKESEKGGRTYFNRWATLRDIYKSKLNTDLFVEKYQLTPHDYDRHCTNIYNILHLIIPSNCYGKGERQLNTEDLFILNVAVLLHDMFLVYSPLHKDIHGQQMQQFIRNEVQDNNVNVVNSILSDDEAKFVGDVIYGHCDIKQNDEIVERTLYSLPNSNFKQGFLGKPINVRLLAGLLRFADELDIDSERIRLKKHLETRIEPNSRKHWRKCKLFALPTKAENDVTLLNLRLNEDEINTHGDMENDVKLICEVKNKICQEFEIIKNVVFNLGYLESWQINTIKIYTDDSSIAYMINKIEDQHNKNPMSLNSTVQGIRTISDNDRRKQISDVKEVDSTSNSTESLCINPDYTLLNKNYSSKIQDIVLKCNLLRDGHFFIGNNTYSRDYIETLSLLSNLRYLDEISNYIIQYIKDNFESIPIQFIGEGFPGLILTSNIAFKMNKPFTYFVPDKDSKIHTNPEKVIKIKKNHKLIIVTDVVVYGNTVKNAIDFLEKNNNVPYDDLLCILSVFYRHPMCLRLRNSMQLDESVKKKLVVINDSLNIEICSKDACFFRDYGLLKPKYGPDNI